MSQMDLCLLEVVAKLDIKKLVEAIVVVAAVAAPAGSAAAASEGMVHCVFNCALCTEIEIDMCLFMMREYCKSKCEWTSRHQGTSKSL
jgi:hypothetical protein